MEIKVADGRVVDVDTDDEEVAISAAFKWYNENPLPEIEAIDPAERAAQLGDEDVSTLGDVARGIVAGPIDAVAGLISLPGELIDLVSQDEGEGSVAQGVRDVFDVITPTTRTGAGKAAKFITQFVVPGSIAANAARVRNLGKAGQIGAFAAADVAATTPDVETLGDFFDGGPTQRIDTENLVGSEVSAANLANRFKVAAEGTALLLGGPAIIKAVAKNAGPLVDDIAQIGPVKSAAEGIRANILDNVGPMASLENPTFISRNIRNARNKLRESEIGAKAGKLFSFKGNQADDVMQSLRYLKIHQVSEADKRIRRNLESLTDGLEVLNRNGALNKTDQEAIIDSINDYIFATPKGNLSRETVQSNAGKFLKDIDDQFKTIDNKITFKNYLGVSRTKSLFSGQSRDLSLLKASTAVRDQIESMSVIIKKDLTDKNDPNFNKALLQTIGDNESFYGRRVYRASRDDWSPLYKADGSVDPAKQKKYDAAIDNILANNESAAAAAGGVSQFGKDDAQKALLSIMGNVKTFSNANMKPLDMFNDKTLQGISTGILKDRKLDNLPAVRDFLGEYTGARDIMGVVGRVKELDGSVKQSTAIGKVREQTLDEQKVGLQYRVSETVSKMNNMIQQKKFFENVNKHNENLKNMPGDKRFLFDDIPVDVEILGKYEKIGDASSNADRLRYGPLAGKYIKSEYARAFQDVPTYVNFGNDTNALNRLYATFLGMKGMSQIAKTVYSPITQIRNATTAALFALKNGNFGNGEDFTSSVKVVFQQINDNLAFSKSGTQLKGSSSGLPRKEQINQFYDEMIRRGVVNTNAKVGEFEDLLGDAARAGYTPSFTKKILETAQNTQNRFSGKLYQGSDDVWKIYSYFAELGRLQGAFKNVKKGGSLNIKSTDVENIIDFADKATPNGFVNVKSLGAEDAAEFLRREAAEIVKDTVPNYSRVPEFIKELRKAPFGNFIAFPAEVIRTSGNIYGRAIRDLGSDSPEIRSIGMRRLVGSLTVDGALGAGLVTAGLTLTGSSREQLEAYKRSFAADYDRDSILIPVSTDKDGNIREVYNFSYTNPYDYLTRPARAVLNAVNDGVASEKDLTDIFMSSAWEGMIEAVAPFGSESIMTEKIFDLGRNQTRYGRSVWGEADPLGLRVSKGLAHLVDGITPGFSPVRLRGDVAGQDIQLGNFTLGADIGDFPKAIGLAVGLDPVTGVNRKGEMIDAAGEFAEALTGLKLMKPKIDLTLTYRGYEASKLVREASGIFNKIAKSKTGMSPEDITQAYIVSNEQRFKALRDLNMAIEDARTLGLKDSEIIKSLKKAKTSNIPLLMAGKFKPFYPSTETIKLAIQAQDNKMSNPFDFGEMRKIYGEGYGKSLRPNRAQEESEARARQLEEIRQKAQAAQSTTTELPEMQMPEPVKPMAPVSVGSAALRQAEIDKLTGI